MNEQKKFLGTGWQFPIAVDSVTGRVLESSYEENIAQSIKIILQTQRGERIMRPDFGCNLKQYTFSEINFAVMIEIEKEIKTALVLWEPRIIDVDVKCRKDNSREGVLLIDISYVVRSTNNPYNMVYPFYLNEGV